MNTGWNPGNLTAPCRSELAREGRESTAYIQAAPVIVNVHRRNAARSKLAPTKGFWPASDSNVQSVDVIDAP